MRDNQNIEQATWLVQS